MTDMTTKKQKTRLAAPARAFRDCLPLFQAFGDTGRQDIILLLAEVDSMNVNQIAEQLTLSRPTISHHLKTLRSAGLVSSARHRERLYAANRRSRGFAQGIGRAGGGFVWLMVVDVSRVGLPSSPPLLPEGEGSHTLWERVQGEGKV